jgi:hypothetical protein
MEPEKGAKKAEQDAEEMDGYVGSAIGGGRRDRPLDRGPRRIASR